MKKFAFKRKDQEHEMITLEDGLGTSIEVPKLGHITVFEELAITDVYVKLQGSNETYTKLKLQALCEFLKIRFEDESLTVQDLAQQAGSQAMIDVLYEFMENERGRWQPSKNICKIEGQKNSADCAKVFAETYGYVVVSRKDLKINNTYFIFKDLESVPDGYDIEFDFSNTLRPIKKNGVHPY